MLMITLDVVEHATQKEIATVTIANQLSEAEAIRAIKNQLNEQIGTRSFKIDQIKYSWSTTRGEITTTNGTVYDILFKRLIVDPETSGE